MSIPKNVKYFDSNTIAGTWVNCTNFRTTVTQNMFKLRPRSFYEIFKYRLHMTATCPRNNEKTKYFVLVHSHESNNKNYFHLFIRCKLLSRFYYRHVSMGILEHRMTTCYQMEIQVKIILSIRYYLGWNLDIWLTLVWKSVSWITLGCFVNCKLCV